MLLETAIGEVKYLKGNLHLPAGPSHITKLQRNHPFRQTGCGSCGECAQVLPSREHASFCRGSLVSWLATNDHIVATLSITPRSWNPVRRDTPLLVIRGSLTITRQHTATAHCCTATATAHCCTATATAHCQKDT
jgi:hypothetical protein